MNVYSHIDVYMYNLQDAGEYHLQVVYGDLKQDLHQGFRVFSLETVCNCFVNNQSNATSMKFSRPGLPVICYALALALVYFLWAYAM